jgi:hypothetical protein
MDSGLQARLLVACSDDDDDDDESILCLPEDARLFTIVISLGDDNSTVAMMLV